MTGSVLSLLQYYKWKKFSIILQEEAQSETIAKHLYEEALKKNFTVNHYRKFRDPVVCCVKKWDECCTSVSTVIKYRLETVRKRRVMKIVGCLLCRKVINESCVLGNFCKVNN